MVHGRVKEAIGTGKALEAFPWHQLEKAAERRVNSVASEDFQDRGDTRIGNPVKHQVACPPR